MSDNLKKKKLIIPMFFVFAVLVVIGTSFALWQLTFTQTGTNVITTGCLNLTLTEDTDAINLVDATPTSDEDGKKLEPFTFTLTNTCTTETSYVINLETLSSGGKTLADKYVKASLNDGSNEVFIDNLLDSHQNLEKVISEASVAYKLYQGKLGSKEKISFNLRLWMDEDTEAVDEVMEASWQGKITVTASYVPKKNDKELYNIINSQAVLENVSSEFVTSETGIDFGASPSDTNGKGVYTIASTKDNEYPVHYFRGNVTNNNVKFANFCWKIVRTTEKGGVKLIYNGIPDGDGGCTNTSVDVIKVGTSKFNADRSGYDDVGYMYPETNENNSDIKTVLDDWYTKNMTSYTKYLEDTIWCNDRSYSYSGGIINYGATERNSFSSNPSIICPNANDKFTVDSANGNGKLTYPVGLLTADEATYAGHGESGYSSDSYLYTNQDWWLISPGGGDYMSGVFGFYITSSGKLDFGEPSFVYSVRPSIALAPKTVISTGDGTQANPFAINVK